MCFLLFSADGVDVSSCGKKESKADGSCEETDQGKQCFCTDDLCNGAEERSPLVRIMYPTALASI